jgi:DNA invertase Pin-like site-specific DNA recombinase
MTTTSSTQRLRAFGIPRQSRGRDDSQSTAEQAKAMRAREKDLKLRFLEIAEEVDVSGGTPLAKRKVLLRAVELVEAKKIDVIVVAYFDRLVRSLKVQEEILTRVEKAGGRVLALDIGEVSNETAAKWLSATALGMINEYQRRTTAERTEVYKAEAVARGVAPFPRIPPGLKRGKDNVLEIDAKKAKVVKHAFEMRAQTPAVPLETIRLYLRDNGIVLSQRGVQAMLASKLLMGELHFGRYVNKNIPRVVEPSLWRRVQETVIPRGRRSKSERLLARQSVLVCATCKTKMVVGHIGKSSRHRANYFNYRCPSTDCKGRAAISATNIEAYVKADAERLLAKFQGRASSSKALQAAEREVTSAQTVLDNTIEAFDGTNAASAKAKIVALQAALDAAVAKRDELRDIVLPLETFSIPADRDSMSIDEWRLCIRFVIDRVEVSPGRLEIHEKVAVYPKGSETPL